jgi:hypothetical protein
MVFELYSSETLEGFAHPRFVLPFFPPCFHFHFHSIFVKYLEWFGTLSSTQGR